MAKSDIQTYETDELIININRTECIACGTCSALAPNTFESDKNLISQVKKTGPWDPVPTIVEAAQSCAVAAIVIIDKKIGKKIWPK